VSLRASTPLFGKKRKWLQEGPAVVGLSEIAPRMTKRPLMTETEQQYFVRSYKYEREMRKQSQYWQLHGTAAPAPPPGPPPEHLLKGRR